MKLALGFVGFSAAAPRLDLPDGLVFPCKDICLGGELKENLVDCGKCLYRNWKVKIDHKNFSPTIIFSPAKTESTRTRKTATSSIPASTESVYPTSPAPEACSSILKP